MNRALNSTLAALVLAPLALTGCTTNDKAGSSATPGSGALSVSATDTECTVSSATTGSGNVVFTVKNDGSKVNEFYLLASDGLRIVGEVENIGPGLTRDLVLRAAPGKYFTVCKPGMVGEGIRSEFTVTDSGVDLGVTGDAKALVDAANAAYARYVKDQTEQLLTATQKFAALYTSGKDAEARALYPVARVHWERIEPVAESFGDLDPKMDAREADLTAGQAWTGWHVMEKDLWPGASGVKAKTPAERKLLADQLVADTTSLYDRTRTITFTANEIANGAKSLLDEVATGKVTGEEEIWSHTDLYDFQANVDGARVAWQGLQPLLKKKDASLDSTLTLKFAALQKLLDHHRQGDGFVSYTALTKPQVKELADAVNALAEPLSKVPAAVTL